jgi:hypothetical protein
MPPGARCGRRQRGDLPAADEMHDLLRPPPSPTTTAAAAAAAEVPLDADGHL